MTLLRSSHALIASLLAIALAGCGNATTEGMEDGDWRASIAAGDGKSAEAGLRRELAGGVAAGSIASYMGEAELLQGNLVEAERWLTEYAFSPEAASHGYRMLGRLRMAQGNLQEAGRAFDRALAVSEKDPELWVDIGRLRWRGGEQAQAIEASQLAMRYGPSNPAALLFRAQLTREARGNRAALQMLEQALRVAPDDPDLLAEYAATLGDLGRATEMLSATRRLATVAPHNSRSLFFQAVLAARAGRADLAVTLLKRSGEFERQVPAAIILQSVIDLEAGNYASAAKNLDRLARRQPDNARVQSLLARSLALGGNYRELMARFSGRATTPYIAMLVGRGYEALGDRQSAASFVDIAMTEPVFRAVPLGTEGAEGGGMATGGSGTVSLVRNRIVSARFLEAREEADQFLVRNPGSSDAAALAGDAAVAAGDNRTAVRHYQGASAIRRTWPLVKRTAAALDLSGQPDRATALVAEYTDGDPLNADAATVLITRRKTGK